MLVPSLWFIFRPVRLRERAVLHAGEMMELPVPSSMQNHPARAPRFAISMPIRYRRAKDEDWLMGQVENISRTGVLFRVRDVFEVDTPLEMRFVLPVEVGGEPGAEVVCEGQSVRSVLPSGSEPRPALAAVILSYKFLRRQEMPGA
jgi:hypothetical protein